jgi:hypothetical protein
MRTAARLRTYCGILTVAAVSYLFEVLRLAHPDGAYCRLRSRREQRSAKGRLVDLVSERPLPQPDHCDRPGEGGCKDE